MSHVTRLPVSTHVSDGTRTSSLRNLSRPRFSKSRFRSTPEPSHDDDMEFQHLLAHCTLNASDDLDVQTDFNDALGSEHPATAFDDLFGIISGTHESATGDWEGGNDTGDWEGANKALTEPPPHRRVVHALNTLIQDIDQQHHIPPRWSHVRPWLLSATQHTPCARPDTTNTNTSFTQLEVPPAVRRYLAASRHGSWDDDARKAARTVRTWVGYDVIAKSVMEVDAANKAKDTDDVWHSWWAV
jgi:hypothetical protein